MRRQTSVAALMIMAISCATFGGGSSLGKFMEAEASYTFALNRLSDARQAGKIDNEAYALLNPIVQEANNILELIENQLRVDPKAKIKIEYLNRLLALTEQLALAYYRSKE